MSFSFSSIRSLILFATGLLLLQTTAVAQNSGSPWNVDWNSVENRQVEPSKLFESPDCPLEIGGWVSAGFTTNAHGNRTGNGNAPFPQNYIADTPIMNQFWIYAEKPLDLEHNDFDWGFRVDYLFGTDAQDTQASGDQGWDFGWNTSRDYGSAIPELYLQAGTGELTVIVGNFFGLQGFESVQSVDNFFYSHNYAFGYGVQGTHSGVLATYQLNDELELDFGWATGWDSSWANYLNASMFIGGFTWNLNEVTSLTYHTSAGDFGDGTAKNGAESNQGDLYSHAIVLTVACTEKTTVVWENTYGSNEGIGSKNNRWYSFTNYLLYEIDDCWEAGLRTEWFRDADGQSVDANGAGAGSYYDITAGLNWTPHPNIRLRPELRWDWFAPGPLVGRESAGARRIRRWRRGPVRRSPQNRLRRSWPGRPASCGRLRCPPCARHS